MPYFSPVKPEQLAVIDCELEIFHSGRNYKPADYDDSADNKHE
jgi:hypothetical protein